LTRASALSLFVTSFSFCEELPRETNFIFDVRFLANPHYDSHLKILTDKYIAVGKSVATKGRFDVFLIAR
jgi:UPF0042 nucleotide-binding protein